MKIIHISDTHTFQEALIIEKCDVLIHSGDFSSNFQTGRELIAWLSKQDAKYKILIAGNHDYEPFERPFDEFSKELLELGIIYLQDSSVTIDGVNFYGSPWTLPYGNYAFMKEESTICYFWENIPDDTHVLITHGPEYGILDLAEHDNRHTGSPSLGYKLKKLKNLKLHLFGHIHEGYGKIKSKDRDYLSVNSAIFNKRQRYLNAPHILYI